MLKFSQFVIFDTAKRKVKQLSEPKGIAKEIKEISSLALLPRVRREGRYLSLVSVS